MFLDRADAGARLTALLCRYSGADAIVCAVPAGGVPVAIPIALKLGLALDLAVVSKITPTWNTEVGYGAVAFDGTVLLNERLIAAMHLDRAEIEADTERTREKVLRRCLDLRGSRAVPDLAGRTAIIVDDGLASGFTLRTAIRALSQAKPQRIALAVPTAHDLAALALGHEVDELYCANLRAGASFAVADAYEKWNDVSLDQAREALQEFQAARAGVATPR